MKRYHCFLEKISQELHICKGNHEDLLTYQCRIVYSVLGRLALASLWDTLEDDQPEDTQCGKQTVSIVRFKDRIRQAAYGYTELYPELKTAFTGERMQTITDEIYQILFRAGYFYHSHNRIAPCAPCSSSVDNLCFTRGMSLNAPQFVSGLGSYQIRPDGVERLISIDEMFHLECSNILIPWQEITAEPVWEPLAEDSTVEFLRLQTPFTKGYWVKKPDLDIVSLCRVTTQGTPRYYLYQMNHNQVLCSPIPEWMMMDPSCADKTAGANVRMFSNSLLANLGVLPPTRYSIDGKTVCIELGYLFPTMEMNIIKLFSWPQTFCNPGSPFKRVFDRSVFLAVKKTLERQGYCFVEE